MFCILTSNKHQTLTVFRIPTMFYFGLRGKYNGRQTWIYTKQTRVNSAKERERDTKRDIFLSISSSNRVQYTCTYASNFGGEWWWHMENGYNFFNTNTKKVIYTVEICIVEMVWLRILCGCGAYIYMFWRQPLVPSPIKLQNAFWRKWEGWWEV